VSPRPCRARPSCAGATSNLEGAAGFNSQLFRYAREIVRAAAERSKPNAERLRGIGRE